MIYVYGHSSSSDLTEFATKDAALAYLRHGLGWQGFRYRTTRRNHANSIIFSFNGELLAELVVSHEEQPTDHDLQDYQKAKKVYVISEVRLFRNTTFRVKDFGLKPSQFGVRVPEDVYAQIIEKVEGFEEPIRRP